MHYGPEQPRIQTEVLGHSLVRSLVRSHRSLTSLTPSLVGKCLIRLLFCLCFLLFSTIVPERQSGQILHQRRWNEKTICHQDRDPCKKRLMHYGTKPGHFETSKIHFPTSEGVSKVSERCERTSEWTSEWPSTYVSILVCSRPQCNGRGGNPVSQWMRHRLFGLQ